MADKILYCQFSIKFVVKGVAESLKIGWLSEFMLDMGFEPGKSKYINYISGMVLKMGVASISEWTRAVRGLWL